MAWNHSRDIWSKEKETIPLIKRNKLDQGALLPNTDGCSKGNSGESGDGGILRDLQRNLNFAFSWYFGRPSSFTVEVEVPLFGVGLCKDSGIGNVHVQLDPKVLVDILCKNTDFPWLVSRDIKELKSFHFNSIGYCFKEANRVADSFTNLGCSLNCNKIFSNCFDLGKLF